MKREQDEQKVANALKEFFKQWPRFYYFVFDVFGPLYFGGVGTKEFLKKYYKQGECYNLGSGTRRIFSGVINVDITDYPNVDMVADILDLPLQENTATAIVCDQVLEHVSKPEKAVSEIQRVLKPGGHAYVSIPFLYPFHASPSDYQRWTHKGYHELFSDFEIIEVGVRSGPFSVLSVYCCYIFASLFSFGNEKIYWTLTLGSTFLFFPIKFLDVVGNRLPNAINMAAVLYCVVRKK